MHTYLNVHTDNNGRSNAKISVPKKTSNPYPHTYICIHIYTQTMDALRQKYPFLKKRLNPYPRDAVVAGHEDVLRKDSFTGEAAGKVLFSGQTKGGVDYWGLNAIDREKEDSEWVFGACVCMCVCVCVYIYVCVCV
jgi:hypothetical protein